MKSSFTFDKYKRTGVFFICLLMHIHPVFPQNSSPDTARMPASAEPDMNERPLNIIFLNVLGDGTLASLNYERLFLIQPEKSFIAAGLGAGINSLVTLHANSDKSYSYDNFLAIPHHITGNIGYRSHFFELGLGGAIYSVTEGDTYLPYVIAGYRVQPVRQNRLNFRLFGTYPLSPLEQFNIIFIPAGFSLGWAF